jgi:hypothetical protein
MDDALPHIMDDRFDAACGQVLPDGQGNNNKHEEAGTE